MIPLQRLILAFLSLHLRSTYSQHHQYYDQTPCSSDAATTYTCTTAGTSCRTFIVYRASHRFSTVSAISNLFQTDSHTLLSVNPNVSTPAQPLQPGHEVLVPVACSCSADRFYRSYFNYTTAINTSISEIACAVYQGLVKSVTLAAENNARGDDVSAGSTLRLPLKCACLEHVSNNDEEIKYLVTYPFIEGDTTPKLAKKFNVPEEEIWKFNGMDPFEPAVFPNTTILVPLRDVPLINFSIPDSDPPTPQFLPTKPVEKERKTPELTKLYVAGSVVGMTLIIALTISCCLYVKALKKFKNERTRALNSCSTPISSPFSTNSCLSPDLLVGVKYSLRIYSVEEINAATKNFSEEVKTSGGIYRCSGEAAMMIKEMRFEGTRQVIDVHSRINHVNIVKLRGVCYGDEERSCCYLVFELPSNGSLRECLKRPSGALQWHRRTQIAFDIATGLHYLHYSVTPAAYRDQLRLSSANIYLSWGWRAKILVSGDNLRSSGAEENVDRSGEIYAFGVVLMEVISGKEAAVMTFMGANEGGCFDQLRSFVDPCLKDDYPLAEALCLAVLAGSCVDHDPMHRPSMEDVLKILARMV
ncbi:lysM domain receptor-like kinase 4 [Salvia miltiorrhiza]|uniref:lysM domain receptor-like kinase 4 n=1 Tax=Salvia miltiorrhiza TaxID=226208 RepID=UPI0025ACD2BF|nr:lysM domain receptor-like kinase 4 [Salvia miltiorrhiza]